MQSGVHSIFTLVDLATQHLHKVAKDRDSRGARRHSRANDPEWSVLRVWFRAWGQGLYIGVFPLV